jgi:hypothetical protein
MIKIRLSANKNIFTKLSVFDFDNTLFKSPDSPSDFKGNWHASKESLNEPTVPKVPDDSFWNLDVVSSAKKELSKPENYCIMLTGRIDQFFQDRIEELLKQKNLNFKLVGLNEFGMDTAEFKINKINEILKRYPTIKNIEMWEDEPEKASIYNTEFKHKNIKINKVKTDMMEKIFENWRRYILKEHPYVDIDSAKFNNTTKEEFESSIQKVSPDLYPVIKSFGAIDFALERYKEVQDLSNSRIKNSVKFYIDFPDATYYIDNEKYDPEISKINKNEKDGSIETLPEKWYLATEQVPEFKNVIQNNKGK